MCACHLCARNRSHVIRLRKGILTVGVRLDLPWETESSIQVAGGCAHFCSEMLQKEHLAQGLGISQKLEIHPASFRDSIGSSPCKRCIINITYAPIAGV